MSDTLPPLLVRALIRCVLAFTLFHGGEGLKAQVLQTDVISSYGGSDTTTFNALFQFNLSVEQQLNTVVNLGAGADFLWNAGDDALILASKAKRSYAGELRVTNSGYGHFRYRMEREAPAGMDLFTQYQWDGPRGMRNRFLLGGNIRYRLLKDSSGSLDAAAGVMYEFERWGFNGIAESDRPADQSLVRVSHPRINTYIRLSRKLSEGVGLLLMNYLQARTDSGFDKPRIATALQFDVMISGKVSLTVSYNSIYDFAPVVPIRRFYFDISNGIIFKI